MDYIILDLEATCWENDRSKQNEIIEIGAVKVSGLKIVGEFQQFINPVINPILTDFCNNLTSIKQSDVDAAKSFPEVLKEFQDWIGKDYVLCSWGFYDRKQFEKDCAFHKLYTKWLDPHISLKHQHAELKNVKSLNTQLEGSRGLGLGRALLLEGFHFDGTPHRGIDDAKNIAKIFTKYFFDWKMPRKITA